MQEVFIFLEGFLSGITLSLMLGTVFFSIVQNSLSYNYKAGILISLGVVISDIFFIALALGSSSFAKIMESESTYISLLGAFLLLGFGLFQVFKKTPQLSLQLNSQKTFSSSKVLFFMGNGILLNVINPVNFFIWLGISTSLSLTFGYSMTHKVVFFAGAIAAIFTTESLIAVFAFRIKKYISTQNLKRVNQIAGTIFIAFGLYMFVKVFLK
jgi:threonine/homoserine/homoserine lactone efflux protein